MPSPGGPALAESPRAGAGTAVRADSAFSRAANPSPTVLAPPARALRLTDDGRGRLVRVAGHAPPLPGPGARGPTIAQAKASVPLSGG
jgi:hypothetical protein